MQICHYPLINGKMLTSNYSSVSTLTLSSFTPINYELCSLQNTIHENIKYSFFFKTQARYVCCESDVMKTQIKLLSQKMSFCDTWIFTER